MKYWVFKEIIYKSFSYTNLYISCCKQKAAHRQTTQISRFTNRRDIDISEICLKHVHICSLILLHFFKIHFIHNWRLLISEALYLHQTFKDTHIVMSTCHMWLQIMERLLILPIFFRIFTYNWWPFMFEVSHLYYTSTNCVSNQYTHFCMSTCQKWLLVVNDLMI